MRGHLESVLETIIYIFYSKSFMNNEKMNSVDHNLHFLLPIIGLWEGDLRIKRTKSCFHNENEIYVYISKAQEYYTQERTELKFKQLLLGLSLH